MRFTEAGRPSVSVVLGSEAGRVERTAAQIVVDEVRERNGVALPVVSEREAGSLAGGLVVLETPSTNRLIGDADVRPEGDERGETIAVRTADVQGRRATRASTRSTTSCSTSARSHSVLRCRPTSTAPPSSCSCAARRRRRSHDLGRRRDRSLIWRCCGRSPSGWTRWWGVSEPRRHKVAKSSVPWCLGGECQ